MKCDNCLNARIITSENGKHSICCLSMKKAMECLMDEKDYKVEIFVKKDGDTDAGNN